MPSIAIDMPPSDDVRGLDQIWNDIPELGRRGKLIWLNDECPVSATIIPHGMLSGRASIALRFTLPDKRVAIVTSSLRALWSLAVTFAARYGEPHMNPQPTNEVIEQLRAANLELLSQLVDAKRRLGDPLTIDMSKADTAYEQAKNLHPRQS